MDKRTLSKKTLLGSAVIPLWVFAMQSILQGQYYTGGAAAVIATALFLAYEYVGLKQIPVSSNDLKDISEQLGDDARDAAGNVSLPRDPETGQFLSASDNQDDN
jgi:hypothetical protein